MNVAPFIFVGLLATFSMSWFGFIYRPNAELSRQEPFKDPITADVYPMGRSGQAMQGAEVYRAQGCAACHTQQVRPSGEGNDLQRGFGLRRTVATDYMLDRPPQLGAIRLGPDLANFGLRKNTNDVNWIYLHLLNPRAIVEHSNMPLYPYLFEKVPAKSGHPGAISIPNEPNFVFIPKDEAKQLAVYLLSLKNEGSVFEAPMKRASAKTNAPAGRDQCARRDERAGLNGEHQCSAEMKSERTSNVEAEPQVGVGEIPVLFVAILAGLVFLGILYLDKYAGGFSSQVYGPFESYDQVSAAQPMDPEATIKVHGRKVYEVTCQLCHQPNGMGTPGQFPPLDGSEWVNGPVERLIRIPNNGLQGPVTIKGEIWAAAMPNMGAALSDQDLSDLLTFIRSSWGNKSGAVTVDQVKKVRGEIGARTDPWTSAELLKIQ